MFTIDDRNRLRALLLEQAEQDPSVVGAAFTGSAANGSGDRWSDTDLVLGVRGDLSDTVDRWTRWLHEEFGTRHHWDLTSEPAVIRVFLLGDWLELDLTFTPEAGFGARGPQWQTTSPSRSCAAPSRPSSPPRRTRWNARTKPWQPSCCQ